MPLRPAGCKSRPLLKSLAISNHKHASCIRNGDVIAVSEAAPVYELASRADITFMGLYEAGQLCGHADTSDVVRAMLPAHELVVMNGGAEVLVPVKLGVLERARIGWSRQGREVGSPFPLANRQLALLTHVLCGLDLSASRVR